MKTSRSYTLPLEEYGWSFRALHGSKSPLLSLTGTRKETFKKGKDKVGRTRVDRDYGVETGTAEMAVWSGEVRAPWPR
jgi:hypothetical protein